MDSYRLKIGDMNVLIQKWNNHKLPVLAVSFEGEDVIYKVASFNSEVTAQWFCDCLAEQLELKEEGAE